MGRERERERERSGGERYCTMFRARETSKGGNEHGFLGFAMWFAVGGEQSLVGSAT
jgi:hypothetical protein